MSVCGQQADTSGGYQSTEYTDPPSTSGNIARNRSHPCGLQSWADPCQSRRYLRQCTSLCIATQRLLPKGVLHVPDLGCVNDQAREFESTSAASLVDEHNTVPSPVFRTVRPCLPIALFTTLRRKAHCTTIYAWLSLPEDWAAALVALSVSKRATVRCPFLCS